MNGVSSPPSLNLILTLGINAPLPLSPTIRDSRTNRRQPATFTASVNSRPCASLGCVRFRAQRLPWPVPEPRTIVRFQAPASTRKIRARKAKRLLLVSILHPAADRNRFLYAGTIVFTDPLQMQREPPTRLLTALLNLWHPQKGMSFSESLRRLADNMMLI